MYKPIITTLIFFLNATLLFGQSKQDYVWLFGPDMSFTTSNGFIFDFNSPPMSVQEHVNNIGISGGNASICDENGNLLFYMNGSIVMNRHFQMMPNGDSLSYDILWDVFNLGGISGLPFFQDNIVLESPVKESEYYIIHKPVIYNGVGKEDSLSIWYSKVDISLAGGLGDVTEKNIELDNSRIFLSSYLTAIKHQNGRDHWIIQAVNEDSIFHTYLLDEDGIHLDTIQNSHQYMTGVQTSATGTAKFSPDGTKYAWYNYADQLHIYDFDRETGILSNHKNIKVIIDADFAFGSLEWSPNSRFIYTASGILLHQVDLWEQNIQEDGIRLIDTYNGTQDPFSTNFFLMAQAPDCKIYMCPTNGSRSFHVIHRPNELGTACNFIQNGLKLPVSSFFGGMPNFPRFRVDEEDKCDPTLTSVFGNEVFYRRELFAYPSPSDGFFFIDLPTEFKKGALRIIDINGQVVLEKMITSFSTSIEVDITSYSSGIYNLELHPDNNKLRIFWGKQVVKK